MLFLKQYSVSRHVKGIVHPEMKIMSSFIYLQVVPNLRCVSKKYRKLWLLVPLNSIVIDGTCDHICFWETHSCMSSFPLLNTKRRYFEELPVAIDFNSMKKNTMEVPGCRQLLPMPICKFWMIWIKKSMTNKFVAHSVKLTDYISNRLFLMICFSPFEWKCQPKVKMEKGYCKLIHNDRTIYVNRAIFSI